MRIPIFAAILLIIITILCDWKIVSDIKRNCKSSGKRIYVRIYEILSVMCLAWLILIIVLPKRSEDHSVVGLMWMLFAYLSIYIPKIIYCFFSLFISWIVPKKSRWRSYGIWTAIALALFSCISMWVGALVTRYQIDIEKVNIKSNKLPKEFDGFKIVQFSDAHVGTWGSDTTFISNLVDSINGCDPDIVLFTGDIVNRKSSELDQFTKVLRRIKAPHGVYAILGNHDYSGYVDWKSSADSIADHNRLISMIGDMGWKLLLNKTEFIHQGNDSIAIIGVENWGEPPFGQIGDLKKAYPSDSIQNLYDGNYKILMTHNPKHWSEKVIYESNVDLSLSGHTHAMQAELKAGKYRWSPAAFRYRLWGGLYNEKSKDGKEMNLYVNIGSGEVGFPARLGAVPELTLITLERE